jgi:hypothetical protein
MKLAIMQPYFLPYIGYFQLIAAVDTFVVYDNIKYTKKGWFNRNRLLLNGADALFSLPLKKDEDRLDVVERELADSFCRQKLLNQFRGAYARAPHFAQIMPLLERIVMCEEQNLFRYIHHSILAMCAHLRIATAFRVSSTVDIDHDLKGQAKVLALCQALGADTYINPIGGLELYDRADFAAHGIELQFLQPQPFHYRQFDNPFVPWLSIVDVLMFNPPERIEDALRTGYALI